MSKVKTVLRNLLVALLLLTLGYVGLTVWENRDNLPFLGEPEETVQISTDWIEAEVESISEYATLAYQYTNISEFEDIREFYGWRLPLTSKGFIIKYNGEMKLGIDGGGISVTLVDEIIHIHLPTVEVLSHVIDEGSIEVFDQTYNVFNQIEIEDYATFAVDQKEIMEKRAYTEGVYSNAQANAEEQIAGFIQNLPGIKGEYQVSVTSEMPRLAPPSSSSTETPPETTDDQK